MNQNEISPTIREKAPLILAEIVKAKSILLHCHPSPDPDSVGSALAMKFALESLGKKATVIRGDSEIPEAFMHFPGATSIVPKNFSETDPKEFDLFIVQDATLDRVSGMAPRAFPEHLTLINIDHHASNKGGAKIDLIETAYPATAQILADLFHEWNIPITQEIATNLFIGIYTDTGGFKYRGVTPHTFQLAAKLVAIAPEAPSAIIKMENSNTPESLAYKALAFNSIEVFCNGIFAIAVISHDAFIDKKIPLEEVSSSAISPYLNRVKDWQISGALIEIEPGKVKCSFRTHDENCFDLSKLTVALGGGGHKAAAGATLMMPIDEAKKIVVEKAKELYNL